MLRPNWPNLSNDFATLKYNSKYIYKTDTCKRINNINKTERQFLTNNSTGYQELAWRHTAQKRGFNKSPTKLTRSLVGSLLRILCEEYRSGPFMSPWCTLQLIINQWAQRVLISSLIGAVETNARLIVHNAPLLRTYITHLINELIRLRFH